MGNRRPIIDAGRGQLIMDSGNGGGPSKEEEDDDAEQDADSADEFLKVY